MLCANDNYSYKKEIRMILQDVKEQIQNDLICLLQSFFVADLENVNGISLEELACQIVVDNFDKLQT